ncbi:hypothetical protein FM038_012560 [Shewanella eurypsychrophilus]|uniref:Transposase n=1 Tax=Shewanella eurypsychrophilus TaxID=2593656 RepID=A0ABX8S4K3_9GAMM|nr:hypothetical protein FM038_012560 [Shewanella eurypsychrophilus]
MARRANREDGCKGAFWEGRFTYFIYKESSLLDEQALLACMMYVDLIPIRAGISNTLQASDYTSIQERINELNTSDKDTKPNDDESEPTSSERLKPLSQFDGAAHLATQSGVPFHFISKGLEIISGFE